MNLSFIYRFYTILVDRRRLLCFPFIVSSYFKTLLDISNAVTNTNFHVNVPYIGNLASSKINNVLFQFCPLADNLLK